MVSIGFPEPSSAPRTPFRSDYPPNAWGLLPQATACSETELLATTFYYLAQKFGRAARSQGMGRFLQRCLSPTLRYCPLCLVEDAFYALPWRLLTLPGCAKHGCYLLEQCGHCGQSMPLFARPLLMAICPTCGGDLRLCQAPALPGHEWPQVIAHDQDLRFLLAPGPTYPTDPQEAIRFIGLRLAYWRLQQGWLASEVAQQFEFPDVAIYGMEGRSTGGAIFERYVRYAAFLGVTFRQLFNTTLPPEVNDHNWRHWCRTAFPREQALVEQVRTAIRTLEAAEKPVSQAAIAQYLDQDQADLRRYPRVKAMLKDVSANRALVHRQQLQKQEQALLSPVQSTLDRLKDEDSLPTQANVCGRVGIPSSTLRNYPRITALIATAAIEFYMERQRQLQQRQAALPQQNLRDPDEKALVVSVQAAIKQLKAENKGVTQKAIAQGVGIHPDRLKRYPQIRLIFDQLLIERRLERQKQVLHRVSQPQSPALCLDRQREAKLVEAVQRAIVQLEADGKPLIQRNIAQAAGVMPSTLRRYPQVREILATVSQKRTQLKQQQKQQREQQLMAQIQVAIAQVEALNMPLTQDNVAQLVGVSAHTLRYYPQVKPLLRQVTAKRQQLAIAQMQQRDWDLADKVQQAAEALTDRGQTVTKQAIGHIVGMDPGGLKKYPHTQAILNQLTQR
jgi:transcriptional regulator with XRE-family HTH domain